MRYINLFENFRPDQGEVDIILKFLKEKFKIKTGNILDKEAKYIILDDKPLYISGTFSSKKWAINKIFLTVTQELTGYSEASIRRAIRDFINLNSKVSKFFENYNWEGSFIDQISDILFELRDTEFDIKIDTVNYHENNEPYRAIHIEICDLKRRFFTIEDILPTLLRIREYLEVVGQERSIVIAFLDEEWYLNLDEFIREFQEEEFYRLDVYIF